MVGIIALKAQSDGLPRGAYQMPYTRYESEEANKGGGAIYHEAFDFDQTKMASEASNQQYVGLPTNGSFVQWTVNEAGRGVAMRFTMPDNESTGEGNTGSLDVYVNNVKVKTVNLTSRYAWQYFRKGEDKCYQLKAGTDKTRMRFDEVHFLLDNSVNAGDVIKIQKGNGDAFEYGVDFIEIEPVPAIKSAPANALNVVDFGANGNSYGTQTWTNTTATACSGGMFSNSTISNALAGAYNASGSTSGNIGCAAGTIGASSATAYIVATKLTASTKLL